MAKHFGERRDPSLGSWSAESRRETEDLQRKKKPVHRSTRDILKNPEDELIAKIDARKAGVIDEEDDFDSSERELPTSRTGLGRADLEDDAEPDLTPEAEQLARGDKFAGKEKPVKLDENLQHSQDKSPPRSDIYDRGLAQDRYPSKEQKSNTAQIRKQRKQKR